MSTLRLLTFSLVLSVSQAAMAADKFASPYVTKGELELEYFGSRSNDSDASKDNVQKHQVAVAYGVTNRWKTELYGKFERDAGERTKFDEVEWENVFQLTERGEYWVDTGLALAYEWTPRNNVADTIEGRLLLAKDLGKTSHMANLVAEKNVGGGPREKLEGKILWSSRYRYLSTFEPGFEIRSDFGELSHTGSFNEQQHAIGPAAYGKVPLGLTAYADALKYRAGYLVGVTDAAKDGDAFLQLEYELHF